MRFWSSLLFLTLSVLGTTQPLPRRGTLGVQLRAAAETVRKPLGLEAQSVLEVVAEANGLKAADLVVGVGSAPKVERFKTFADWNEMLRGYTDKDSVPLLVLRKSESGEWQEQAVTVKILPKPVEENPAFDTAYDHVVSNGHRIRTILTRPKLPGRHPVLFWIQGINATTVDWPLATKNAVAPAIRAFAETGYVTVRVEKPGVGDSEGGPARLVGWDEEMDIYREALKSLDKYEFVDRGQVYVFGHSMGGCHAPVVCSEIPVKGIVTYGTVAMSWLEWAVRAPRVQGVLGGQTHAQIDQDVRKTAQFYTYLYTENKDIAWIKTNRPELSQMADENSPDGVMLGDRSIRYMREVNARNFCEYWPKLGKTRVLALFGEFDWIALKDDQAVLAESVNAANPGMAELKIVPQTDHIFARCDSMKDSFANFGRQEFNPNFVQMVKDWIASIRD